MLIFQIILLSIKMPKMYQKYCSFFTNEEFHFYTSYCISNRVKIQKNIKLLMLPIEKERKFS